MKKAKRRLIEGQLDRFVMLDNEGPQEMYNRLKKLVNKVRAYCSRRWRDRRVIDRMLPLVINRMLRAYDVKDTTVISLIQQDPTFKKLTPDEEANHVKNLSKGITSSRKQDIAFKASKKSKKVVEESSSKEEEDNSDDENIGYDPDEMALFIRRFSKMMSKQNFFKGDKKGKFRTKTKRACYSCSKYDYYITNCPHERREEEDNNNNSNNNNNKERSYKKDKPYKKKAYVEAHIRKE
jgi:hypothetical protein